MPYFLDFVGAWEFVQSVDDVSMESPVVSLIRSVLGKPYEWQLADRKVALALLRAVSYWCARLSCDIQHVSGFIDDLSAGITHLCCFLLPEEHFPVRTGTEDTAAASMDPSIIYQIVYPSTSDGIWKAMSRLDYSLDQRLEQVRLAAIATCSHAAYYWGTLLRDCFLSSVDIAGLFTHVGEVSNHTRFGQLYPPLFLIALHCIALDFAWWVEQVSVFKQVHPGCSLQERRTKWIVARITHDVLFTGPCTICVRGHPAACRWPAKVERELKHLLDEFKYKMNNPFGTEWRLSHYRPYTNLATEEICHLESALLDALISDLQENEGPDEVEWEMDHTGVKQNQQEAFELRIRQKLRAEVQMLCIGAL
ncbi:hypothetical protein EXIGLDRAFT_769894 [Exidia glandulosa HHB12029]|uniref:Uncharacterized protein n=1 Tax=Exidia glandulosa HHB12029 TaxID=1314781 RepID=A0A165H4V8_EXIGL|nr:hypothetical protein EXIGLDRAFT_769894 [Exidia glandulosa HHB12029]